MADKMRAKKGKYWKTCQGEGVRRGLGRRGELAREVRVDRQDFPCIWGSLGPLFGLCFLTVFCI